MGNNEAGNTPDSVSGAKKPAFQISKEPVVYGKPEEDVHKYEATIGEPPEGSLAPPTYEDLGTLPSTYGSRSLFLIARDPHWFFTYWDIDWHSYPPSLMQGGKVILKLYNPDGAEVHSAEVNPEARNWYVPVSKANTTFYAEIGFVNQQGAWELIARSNDATTPSDGISTEVSDCFATVPYHLAFQKVMDLVKSNMTEGESLLAALARIQGEGRKLILLLGSAPDWTDEQRRVLAALLGNNPGELIGLKAQEIDTLLRKQLKERLFSESSSGLLGQGVGVGESSLFSGRSAFGSWTEVSSWPAGAESSLLSSWLSSWGGGKEVLSSWLASWGGPGVSEFWSSFLTPWSGAQERAALSSWLASWAGAGGIAPLSSWLASWSGVKEVSFWSSYLSSWSGKENVGVSSWLSSWGGLTEVSSMKSWLSSWGGGPETLSSWLASWAGAKESAFWSSFLSSWPTAVGASETAAFWSSWLSSWPAPVGASESAFWSSWLSSWPAAVTASSAFGSREFGASWSAQPFGGPRELSLDLNTEVTFRGTTHPNAKIWIDGNLVPVNPDGTFHFHFKFPGGDFTVPILAQSPDGSEQRSATLRLERDAIRRGVISATPQPTHLSDPTR